MVGDGMFLNVLFLIVGFIVIIKSSDILVDAASSLALGFKIPKMLIALTIVSFGTCAPEVAISFQSVSNGDGVMAFANVIGSCIVNVFLIIGLASFIRPIKVKHATIKKKLPLLLTITFAFSILMLDGFFNPLTSNTFSRKDSLVLIVLFSMFILYLVGMLFRRKRETEQVSTGKFSTIASCFLLVISIILIIYSSDLIIDCAKNIASALHVSEKIITMTAIVIGTSLPELIMTVTSAKKGEFDMAIGNIIGTNIFNICIVLGLPILIYGDIVLEGFGFIDILAVFLSSFLLFIFARSERTISKKEAIVMLLVFVIYYAYLLI